ncbi:MAG: asparagine synthase (glutamine-hydrolyzing) [Deltaproteobacteria bacterium]|jgi:asparagine synthase (glutamine-hydrolysing)|nr:asparagine synthase (glutamine-hydrolyzing) [Deltaproteobacteria bacterium]
MCGIAGIYDLGGAGIDTASLDRMVAALHHRGPDARGTWTRGPIALGHTRLSIIDLEGGAQPMSNPAGFLHITFNGEIFNYRELREELVEKGHSFATRSDTEVILHLYEERGQDCVEDLNGQFAFAIWDERSGRLFLARDRLGIRPLYFSQPRGKFLFASEVKALLRHPEVRGEIDLEALDEIFTFWCPVAPRTIFRGIRELPPGTTMTLEEGRSSTRTYWQLDYHGSSNRASEAENAAQLRELLIDATRLRLRSDVPVGAYLSGGLDSSALVAMVEGFSDTPLRTFSVAFEDPELDESRFQQEMIRHLHTDHSELRCSSRDIGAVFPDVIQHAETPLIRTAPAPLFLLSRLVRESGFKVVLTGEGADEVLGGYDLFKEAKIRRFWAAMPDSRLRPQLLERLYPYMEKIQAQPEAYRRAFFHVRSGDLASPFFSHLPRWELTSWIKRFYSREVKAQLADFDVYAHQRERLPSGYDRWDAFEQAQYLESSILMPGYILSSQGDRMAMGHSVEGRFPFLDHRVVEFAAGLPPRLKMKVLNEKFLLKEAVRDLLPSSITRRPKQPYRAPDAVSLLGEPGSGDRPEYVDALLSARALESSGIFDPSAVRKLLRRFECGRAIGVRDNMAVVGILSTQLLAHQFTPGLQSREWT